jgi:ABC-type Fe3+/spermidine/putrescine transport system ATPase subunit
MLDIQNVEVAFDQLRVLRGVSLSIDQGEIVCLLGPSGCGKTTLLRVIAGLETPRAGDVKLDGASILHTPIHQRGFGLMFQDFALFPHLDVLGNVEFGLKMTAIPPAQRQTRAREVLELVGLARFEKRDIAQLSGGEQQRVALARSLAPNPRLLMLDEPLGSLDALLREHLVVELREIIKQVGLTALYVTHDQHEAFAIADRIVLMNAGKIEQMGRPEVVYRNPASPFVARFLGLNNVFPILSRNNAVVHTAVGDFSITTEADAVLLHPDGVRLGKEENGYTISGKISACTFMGDAYSLEIETGSGSLLRFKVPSSDIHALVVGDTITVSIQPEWIIPLVTPPNEA